MLNFWIEHTPCISGSSTSASLDNRGCYLLKGMACFIFSFLFFLLNHNCFCGFQIRQIGIVLRIEISNAFLSLEWEYRGCTQKILGELSFHSNLLFFSEKLLLLSVSDHFGLFVVKNLLSVRNLARHTRSTVSCVSVSDFVKKRALEHAIWLSSPDFPELPIFHGELLNNPYIQRDNLRSYLSLFL